jgi:hypothetical protein
VVPGALCSTVSSFKHIYLLYVYYPQALDQSTDSYLATNFRRYIVPLLWHCQNTLVYAASNPQEV